MDHYIGLSARERLVEEFFLRLGLMRLRYAGCCEGEETELTYLGQDELLATKSTSANWIIEMERS
jgi:hypothetical protein